MFSSSFTLSLLSLVLLPILPAYSQTLSLPKQDLIKESVIPLNIDHVANKLKISQASSSFDLDNQQVAQGTSGKTWQGTLDENSEVMEDGTYFAVETFEGKAE